MTHPVPFGFKKVVFLSHVVGEGTPVFPGDPPVEIRTVATIDRDGYYLQSVTVGEQSGTHWAAPSHFHAGQAAADELDPVDFFHPAVVLDSAVIKWTGFEDRWADPVAYLNADSAGRPHYPGFGAEAARWLIEHRSVRVLGTDTMGIDPGADTEFRANQVLLRGHRLHLENLCGLSQMPPAGGWIIIGGLRIRAGSGSPATVFGLIP
jgi:kynurenine formamidase